MQQQQQQQLLLQLPVAAMAVAATVAERRAELRPAPPALGSRFGARISIRPDGPI
jgi:hypothetical protein